MYGLIKVKEAMLNNLDLGQSTWVLLLDMNMVQNQLLRHLNILDILILRYLLHGLQSSYCLNYEMAK